jgi:hypothetical protein
MKKTGSKKRQAVNTAASAFDGSMPTAEKHNQEYIYLLI